MTNAVMRPDLSSVEVTWPDGSTNLFPYIWLRDNDPAGLHPDTKERIADLTELPRDLTAQQVQISDRDLSITWSDTVTRLELDWLAANRPGTRRVDPADIPSILWRSGLGAAGIPRAKADAVLADDSALQTWMQDTKAYGLSIVEGLADSTEAGMDVARRIGFLRETNFGLTFEVKSKPNPNNLAYTPIALPMHTDLPNQELAPGFQFLHCLANDAVGGGSLFCDGFAIANDLRTIDPAAFALLSTTTIPFRFHDAGCDIRSRKEVIRVNGDGDVYEFAFNAHIADILDLPPEHMAPFYAAYRKMMEMTRDAKYLVTLKLQAGEMVVFDNRRALHGREAFDPSTGYRHLHGCYVDRGEFDSRMRVLAR